MKIAMLRYELWGLHIYLYLNTFAFRGSMWAAEPDVVKLKSEALPTPKGNSDFTYTMYYSAAWAKQQIPANNEWWVAIETGMPCRGILSDWTKQL